MEIEKLKQIHEKVKAHPFRLGNKNTWKEFYGLLNELDKEFTSIIEKKFKDSGNGWGFFIHELRSAIWHFQFEFNEDKHKKEWGRADCDKEIVGKQEYGKINPEYQNKISIILENYIQQIHRFIITGKFEEFLTHYLGGDDCYNNYPDGRSRWNKYSLNKETNAFKFVGKLK